MANNFHYGTGRRKSATARVFARLGDGTITVNGKHVSEYFPRDTVLMLLRQPLEVTKMADRINIQATIKGGGSSGQAGALLHGIARALADFDETLRKPLRQAGFLTRDARIPERKKVGLRKARKRPQYSKR